jgi:hypothetical protein
MRFPAGPALLLLAIAGVSGRGADPDPPAAPPWRIVSAIAQSLPPNAPLNKKGEVAFTAGDKPQGIVDENGKMSVYSTDPATRMVLLTPAQGKSRFLNRFLWVTVHFEQDPAGALGKFVLKDQKGDPVGRKPSKFVHRQAQGKALPEGDYLLVFERDTLPEKAGESGSFGEWRSLDGLVLAGLDHQAPLLARKEAAPPPPDKAKEAAANPGAGADENEQAAARKLRLAKDLAKDGLVEKARERYRDIVTRYPDTQAAAEAKKLLENKPDKE